MAGGKTVWVEVETESPQRVGIPAKGGQRSSTSVILSGKESLKVGSVNNTIHGQCFICVFLVAIPKICKSNQHLLYLSNVSKFEYVWNFGQYLSALVSNGSFLLLGFVRYTLCNCT